jgi:hypothetical protein
VGAASNHTKSPEKNIGISAWNNLVQDLSKNQNVQNELAEFKPPDAVDKEFRKY